MAVIAIMQQLPPVAHHAKRMARNSPGLARAVRSQRALEEQFGGLLGAPIAAHGAWAIDVADTLPGTALARLPVTPHVSVKVMALAPGPHLWRRKEDAARFTLTVLIPFPVST